MSSQPSNPQAAPPVVAHDISETFWSVQGEGLLTGTPSTFIRYAFCDLSCSWCDAAYTWKGNVKYDVIPTEKLVLLAAKQGTHTVLTGGEPTIAPGFGHLLRGLWGADQHITVETNGRQDPLLTDMHGYVGLWSVSPKLGSSGQEAMLNPDALRHYLDVAAEEVSHVQLKFVIDSDDDFDAAFELCRHIGVDSSVPIFLQPNGLCHTVLVKQSEADPSAKVRTILTDQSPEPRAADVSGQVRLETPYLDRVRWLYEKTLRDAPRDLHVRATTQAHKFAFGNQRGR